MTTPKNQNEKKKSKKLPVKRHFNQTVIVTFCNFARNEEKESRAPFGFLTYFRYISTLKSFIFVYRFYLLSCFQTLLDKTDF